MIGRKVLFALAACGGFALPSTLHAQRAPFAIPDPDPEVELKSFLVADGFEVNLFAADPVLAKPIQMNFDPQGRLWVVSSEVYPQIKPGQTANDKVLILEDNDGDGRAERTSVFADGLLIPTGVEPGDGGAYVANSTELLHFADTDGDGKADRRRVMLSGFGTEDTHHILHTLRWGHDGMLYFNQSVYIHSHVETPHGVRRLGGGGTWQFRPETMELEIFTKGLWNPWGHHFDRWGQSFMTDGAGGEGIHYAFPGIVYNPSPGAVRVMPGLNPGSPKYCGFEFLSGRHLPESWRGSLLTADFRGNRVCRFVISEDGSGYASREQPELIKTRHVAFRPIDVKMGPDGAIYIADWYNPIIQHGEVDFRDPRRDHTRGRIWRVTAKGRPLVERPRLAGRTDLLDELKSPEDWTRHNARRLIKEGGKRHLPALASWVKRLDPAAPDFEHQRLEALWTYQSLDEVEPELLATLLRSKEPRVRAAATRVAGLWQARLADPRALLEVQVADEHPRVRLEAVRALARVPGSRSAALAMRALARPMDRFLDYALWLTARDLESSWLPDVQAGRFDFDGNVRHLVVALQSVATPGVVKPLVELLRAGRIPAEQVEGALTTVATLGEPADLRLVFDLAVTPGPATAAQRTTLLAALTRQKNVRPPGDLGGVGRWLDDANEPLRVAAARAAGAWKVAALKPRIAELARGATTPPAVVEAAIDALVQLGDAEELRRLAGESTPARTQVLAIAGLSALDVNDAARRAVDRLARTTEPSEVDTLLARFVQIQRGPAALVTALKGKALPAETAKLAIRAAHRSLAARPALDEALAAAGGLTAASQLPSADELARIVADVPRLGDPARGEAVFRRKGMDCLKCHAVAGAGGQVGPGLESVGASAQVDYLVDSLFQPSKAIKENYHSIVVATSDGKVTTGIKVRQNGSSLVVRDAEDREVDIPLSTIEEQKAGGSLMPTGVTDTLPRSDLLDLVRFLSELGKIGPYSVGKERLVRRWRVLEPTREDADVISRTGLDAAVEGQTLKNWVPAYSMVSGVLPLNALMPTGTYQGFVGMARAELDVTTAGPVRLAFSSIEGLRLWVDGNKVETRPAVTLDLRAGVHTLTLSVDMKVRKEGIRCALEDEPGSPARAQIVLGK